MIHLQTSVVELIHSARRNAFRKIEAELIATEDFEKIKELKELERDPRFFTSKWDGGLFDAY